MFDLDTVNNSFLFVQCQAKEDQLLEEEGRVQCLNRELVQHQKSLSVLQSKLQEDKQNTDLEVSFSDFTNILPFHLQ